MEAQLISLDNYILSGGGANGESYHKKGDPSVLLKLYFPGKEKQAMAELTLSRQVYLTGIPVPEPGQFVVTEDGRYGVLFRRIEDKVSVARAVGDNPDKVETYASRFARMCHMLHSARVDVSVFRNVKDIYLNLLEISPLFSFDQKRKIEGFIRGVPDRDTAVHGDLQFGNVLLSPEKDYFIDLGDFCYGHPYFDLGMVYLTCKLNGEDFIKETFHMDKRTAVLFWEAFAREYFGGAVPLEEIEAEILPYAGLKTLIIERDTGRPMPEFRAALEKTIL